MTQAEFNALIHNTNALIWGHWNETASANDQETNSGSHPVNYGQAVHLTLRFLDPAALPLYLTVDLDVLVAPLGAHYGAHTLGLSMAHQQAALAAFDAWASVANVFRDRPATDDLKTISLGFLDFPNDAVQAYTVKVKREAASRNAPEIGDIWFSDDLQSSVATPGSQLYEVMLHEIGHALGLKHPVSQDPGEEGPFFNDSSITSARYSALIYGAPHANTFPSKTTLWTPTRSASMRAGSFTY